jgi:hypothetical protein
MNLHPRLAGVHIRQIEKIEQTVAADRNLHQT